MADYKFDQNTLVIAPTGSGKTNFILNHLCKDKKTLYLCDNNNLEKQVLLEKNTQKLTTNVIPKDSNIVYVMTYKRFGMLVKFDIENTFIHQFDIIVADEIHNLVDYQKMSNDLDLYDALIALLKVYKDTIIAMFTATPLYLDRLKQKYPMVDVNFQCEDFTNDKRIIKYINRREAYISHISHITIVLSEYLLSFVCNNSKCLIYTETVTNMKKIEEICQSMNFKTICIWGEHYKEPMSDTQLQVRSHLINTGELLEPYNILIINRSLETGVNIYDKLMQLVIVHTSNPVQQVQARGRVRHDVDLLIVRTNELAKLEFITFPVELLDVWIPKEHLKLLAVQFNLKNENKKFVSATEFAKILESRNYIVSKQRKQLDGERVLRYKISLPPF